MELAVFLAIMLVLGFVLLPIAQRLLMKDPRLPSLSNMIQLHLATRQMAQDGMTKGDTNLGWPGDSGGGYSNWMSQLVPAYLTTNEFCKLMSAQRRIMPPDKLPRVEDAALLVYAVRRSSQNDTVFLSSANFTYSSSGGVYDKKVNLYSIKGFVLFRKDGTGVLLAPKQAGDTNLIGAFAPLCR